MRGISGSLMGGTSTTGSGIVGGVSGDGGTGGVGGVGVSGIGGTGVGGGVGGVLAGITPHATFDLMRTLMAVRALSQLFTD